MGALYFLIPVAIIAAIVAGTAVFLSRRGKTKHFRRFVSSWVLAFTTLLGTWMIMIIVFAASIGVSIIAALVLTVIVMIIANAKLAIFRASGNKEEAAFQVTHRESGDIG